MWSVTCGLQLRVQFNVLSKFSERTLEMAYGREINTELTSALVNIPAVNTLNCTSSKLTTSVTLCRGIKLHFLKWPFTVTSPN